MNGWLAARVVTEQGLEQDFVVKCATDYFCAEHRVVFIYKPNECNYAVWYNHRVLSLHEKPTFNFEKYIK